jgi:hypothetical protein
MAVAVVLAFWLAGCTAPTERIVETTVTETVTITRTETTVVTATASPTTSTTSTSATTSPSNQVATGECYNSPAARDGYANEALLLSVHDSVGGTFDCSRARHSGGGTSSAVIHVGDTVRFTLTGQDPLGQGLEFKADIEKGHGCCVSTPWGSSNEFAWQVTTEDFGPDLAVTLSVRNLNGQATYQSLGDDTITIWYDVS